VASRKTPIQISAGRRLRMPGEKPQPGHQQRATEQQRDDESDGAVEEHGVAASARRSAWSCAAKTAGRVSPPQAPNRKALKELADEISPEGPRKRRGQSHPRSKTLPADDAREELRRTSAPGRRRSRGMLADGAPRPVGWLPVRWERTTPRDQRRPEQKTQRRAQRKRPSMDQAPARRWATTSA
jgi:hypothetical protein